LNDAYFINALIENFRKKSKKIKRFKDENWLKYENGGGADNIPNTIISILSSFERLPKSNHNYLRAIVILDSDRQYVGMPLKNDKQKIIDFCKMNEIKYHILEKREMENYIPNEVFDEIAFETDDEYLKAYNSLSPIAKDYFDIEKGFIESYTNLHFEVKKLFKDDDNFKLFRKKWKPKIFHSKGSSFKSEFPKLFEHKNVTQQNLLNRVIHQNNKNELQEILSKINELL
jgi:hypothetical protein